jgi:hypothetical protein
MGRREKFGRSPDWPIVGGKGIIPLVLAKSTLEGSFCVRLREAS